MQLREEIIGESLHERPKSFFTVSNTPDSKFHGANMGPIWGRQDPVGPNVGPMSLAISDIILYNWRQSPNSHFGTVVKDDPIPPNIATSQQLTCDFTQTWRTGNMISYSSIVLVHANSCQLVIY